jgi:hypothetical protein
MSQGKGHQRSPRSAKNKRKTARVKNHWAVKDVKKRKHLSNVEGIFIGKNMSREIRDYRQ